MAVPDKESFLAESMPPPPRYLAPHHGMIWIPVPVPGGPQEQETRGPERGRKRGRRLTGENAAERVDAG